MMKIRVVVILVWLALFVSCVRWAYLSAMQYCEESAHLSIIPLILSMAACLALCAMALYFSWRIAAEHTTPQEGS